MNRKHIEDFENLLRQQGSPDVEKFRRAAMNDTSQEKMFREMEGYVNQLSAHLPKGGADKTDVAYLSKRMVARIFEIELEGKSRQQAVGQFMAEVQRLDALYKQWGKGNIMHRLVIQTMQELLRVSLTLPSEEVIIEYIKESKLRRRK